jgi:hypothetical protein
VISLRALSVLELQTEETPGSAVEVPLPFFWRRILYDSLRLVKNFARNSASAFAREIIGFSTKGVEQN